MKAAYFDEHSGPEVLKYGELPDPAFGPGSYTTITESPIPMTLEHWNKVSSKPIGVFAVKSAGVAV